ncbi:hypothetical protein [Mesorhizobium sp. NPDC059025]|uniref:hypothetical protein n=1 Tax=unclassified Mesorhizobium TaxID=325217 RepID=UPI00366BF422
MPDNDPAASGFYLDRATCRRRPYRVRCAERHSDGTAKLKVCLYDRLGEETEYPRKRLTAIEDEAHRIGLKRLYLETGTDTLATRKLYESFGFAYCEPFGQYRPDPLSVFMTKALDKAIPLYPLCLLPSQRWLDRL